MTDTALKGLILAAGRGSRLRPLTASRSKPMLPLANRPLIDYPLQKLIEIGVRDIGIVVGDNEDELRSGLAAASAELSFIRQPQPLGLADAVRCARDFCGGSDFILLFCDNLFTATLHSSLQLWRELRRNEPQCHCLIHTTVVEDPRAFGVAVVEDGWATELEEKPQQPKSNRAIIGIDFFTPRIFEMIPLIRPSARGELEITDAISELLRQGDKVRVEALAGPWFDTGTFPALIDAHQVMCAEQPRYEVRGETEGSYIEGLLELPASSRLINCSVSGPVLIGEDTVIRDSQLGPAVSIGDGCSLESCILINSQVYSGTSLSYAQDQGAIHQGSVRIDSTTPPAL